jgi:hypothetical protein
MEDETLMQVCVLDCLMFRNQAASPGCGLPHLLLASPIISIMSDDVAVSHREISVELKATGKVVKVRRWVWTEVQLYVHHCVSSTSMGKELLSAAVEQSDRYLPWLRKWEKADLFFMWLSPWLFIAAASGSIADAISNSVSNYTMGVCIPIILLTSVWFVGQMVAYGILWRVPTAFDLSLTFPTGGAACMNGMQNEFFELTVDAAQQRLSSDLRTHVLYESIRMHGVMKFMLFNNTWDIEHRKSVLASFAWPCMVFSLLWFPSLLNLLASPGTGWAAASCMVFAILLLRYLWGLLSKDLCGLSEKWAREDRAELVRKVQHPKQPEVMLSTQSEVLQAEVLQANPVASGPKDSPQIEVV